VIAASAAAPASRVLKCACWLALAIEKVVSGPAVSSRRRLPLPRHLAVTDPSQVVCHNERVRSAEIIAVLRDLGLPHGELAQRAGMARETLSRWETGAQRPSLEDLEKVVTAAGARLDVQVVLPDPKLVELVGEQLDIASPTERLKAMLGNRWRGCRDALRATHQTGELAVVVGPVAAALRGAPERPGSGRVDLLVPAEQRAELTKWLLRADAWPDGIEQAPHSGERRERWRAGRGQLTVRSQAAGIEDIAALRDRAYPVLLNREDACLVRVALVEDLLELVEHSPWPEDALYRAGLRAVLASGRYSSRKARKEHLASA
jgi:transcriptional regulator with XRE-family HTH domain